MTDYEKLQRDALREAVDMAVEALNDGSPGLARGILMTVCQPLLKGDA